ncbi:DUF6544 family protein [Hydrogenophaga sp. 5NK40-0174]|uniref:DUF6544 family protein n=1 Tax=Hydrogenophaga sp. 5NK40-0174 TaxID=3127649 RepID=UPI0031058862
MRWFLLILVVVALVAAGLTWRRWADQRLATRTWTGLTGRSGLWRAGEVYEPSMVDGLPAPARRYFQYVIQPGARLTSTALLTMEGTLDLGDKRNPKPLSMTATQVLSCPHGLVWQLRGGDGAMSISGSDGMGDEGSWTRFWLGALVPVARVGPDPDHLRAAFGRVVVEAAIWTPAALLPQAGVRWERVDNDTARAHVTHRGMTQAVDIHVDEDGQPQWVRIQRWTNANPQKVYQLQPFGGFVSDFREVDGYRLPFAAEAGNFFMTDDYFPFFQVRLHAIRLLTAQSR